jgi:hypothetical protein
MFGNTKDFFGSKYLRYKNLMDQEKQEKIENVKKNLAGDAEHINLKELFIEKQKYFDDLIQKRIIMTRREANTLLIQAGDETLKVDLIEEVIKKFLFHDRLDAIENLMPFITPNQRLWAKEAIKQHHEDLQAATLEEEGEEGAEESENDQNAGAEQP